jgi:hypothetical protein
MMTAATTLLVVVVIFVVVLFVARTLLRLAIKLAFIGAVIVALTGGGLFGWWRGWLGPSYHSPRSVSQPSQQKSPARRPTPR